jgi:DNA adenine methylase
MNIQPAIKWSGSKRSQSEKIITLFPNEINTYYEPFCGGCSVLYQLMMSSKKVKRFIASDLNNDLIKLWNLIKNNPSEIIKEYKLLWNELNKDNDLNRKNKFYFSIRERFNQEKSPTDFMFIMRTTVNGMPRYNNNGKFNNAFHLTRNGIKPDTLKSILLKWNELLLKNNVYFINQSYENIQSNNDDVLYLDPPYAGTKGMYFGAINYSKLWGWLKNQKGKWILSFDGKTTTTDSTYPVPKELYKNHIYLYAGNSSFRRIIGKSNSEYVSESLYKNY